MTCQAKGRILYGTTPDACNADAAPKSSLCGRRPAMSVSHESVIYELVADRFWSLVDQSGECWLWTGTQHSEGYGRARFIKGNVYAHRLAWMLTNGAIPKGLLVCHNCPAGDNPLCCNPAHLWLGTSAQNTRDMMEKGRGQNGGNVKLSPAAAVEIRNRYAVGGVSHAQLAHEYGVSGAAISYVINRKTWDHVEA
jgi:hypothetical protein